MSKIAVQALSDSLFSDVGADITPADLRTFNDALIDDYQEEVQQLTTAEITALTPTNGLLVYNTDLAKYGYYNGTAWKYFLTEIPVAEIQTIKVTVTSAEILDAYDTPVELIPAPPAGFYIDPISIVYRFDYDSTPYATNTSGIIVLSDEGSVYDIDLTRANSDVCKTSNSGDFVTDGAMLFTVETGNPTAGDSDLIIFITYQVIEL
jgi:hypothetical protein